VLESVLSEKELSEKGKDKRKKKKEKRKDLSTSRVRR
jgi:hypothetical protein